jgi:hypothetical protein
MQPISKYSMYDVTHKIFKLDSPELNHEWQKSYSNIHIQNRQLATSDISEEVTLTLT